MAWFRRARGGEINAVAKERQSHWIDCKNQSETLRVLDKLAKAGLRYELSVVYQAHIPERESAWDGVRPEVKAGLKWYVKVDKAQLEAQVKRDARDKFIEDLKL